MSTRSTQAQVWRGFVALIFTAIGAAFFAGCSGSGTSSGEIPVLLRFENVRKDASLDEWAAIAHILNKHSSQEVKPRFARTRRVAGADLRDVSAVVTVDSFSTLDEIHQEILELASTRVGGDSSWLSSMGLTSTSGGQTIDFSIHDTTVTYQSAFVTSAVSIVISGQTTPNSVVKLHLKPGEPPLALTANRSGAWSTRVDVLPETREVYGSAEDPKGRTRTKYFRINLNTLRHENITEEDFFDGLP